LDSESSKRLEIKWDIKPGDLVRAKHYECHMVGNKIYYRHGIVVGERYENQITLFPEIDVYIFETQEIRCYTAGQIEIISNS